MNKIFKVLEIIWLVMGCIGVIMCGYFIVIKDNQGAVYFLVFALVSGLMYIRNRQRRKVAASQQQNEKK